MLVTVRDAVRRSPLADFNAIVIMTVIICYDDYLYKVTVIVTVII